MIVTLKNFANDVLGEDSWKINNILQSPKSINAISPTQIYIEENAVEENKIKLFCNNYLTQDEIYRNLYTLTNNIQFFIEQNKEKLQEYSPKTNFDEVFIDICNKEDLNIELLFKNLGLIKMMFIRKLDKKELTIGCSQDEKYITPARNVKFYATYSHSKGHHLLSESIEFQVGKLKREKGAISITPKIEVDNNEIYISIVCSLTRFLTQKDKFKALKWTKARENSIVVFVNETYYHPSLTWERDIRLAERTIKNLKSHDSKYIIIKHLKENYNITIDTIRDSITAEEDVHPNILISYNHFMGRKPTMKKGISLIDKWDIVNSILDKIEGLSLVYTLPQVDFKTELKETAKNNLISSANLNSNNKILLERCIWRNPITNIDLFIIYRKEDYQESLYTATLQAIEDGVFEKDKELPQNSEGMYLLELSNKTLTLRVHDIEVDEALGARKVEGNDTETLKDRREKIERVLPKINNDSISIALMSVPQQGKIDAKQIIRNALDSMGIVNQNILPPEEKAMGQVNSNKIRTAIQDLLDDIGLANINQEIKEDEIIYTMYKANRIPLICRLDNHMAEINIPCINDKYYSLNEIVSILYKVNEKRLYIKKLIQKKLINEEYEKMEREANNKFLEDIKKENKKVICILENGEIKRDSMLHCLNGKIQADIREAVEYFITTDMLETVAIQVKNNSVTKPSVGAVYKLPFKNCFISMGSVLKAEKGARDESKFREWVNSKGKITYGFKKEYASRNAYEIRMNKDELRILKLIHNLRLAVTTDSHLNMTIGTKYIGGLSKNIKDFTEK